MNGWEWIKTTEELQVESYGNDLRSMSGSERDQHIRDNVLAATAELHEALDETSWKPWSTETGQVNRENFKGEIVDVLHFIGNLILLGNLSEEEVWIAYREKQQRNRDRMGKSGGYQASKNKCPGCRRELDRPRAYQHVGQSYHETVNQAGTAVKQHVHHTLICNGCKLEFVYLTATDETLPGQAWGVDSAGDAVWSGE